MISITFPKKRFDFRRYDIDDGSPLNLGKNYEEYLLIEENKTWRRLLLKGKKNI